MQTNHQLLSMMFEQKSLEGGSTIKTYENAFVTIVFVIIINSVYDKYAFIFQPMIVYFVRHGESRFNKEGRHQYPCTELSDTGIKQAKALAKNLRTLDFDHIISSSYQRAQQTTNAINHYHQKDIEISDLFVERKRPSFFEGKMGTDPKIISIKKKMEENFHEMSWRWDDEENFYDLKIRAKKAMQYLENMTHQRMLVVTHGDFIKYLSTKMLFGSDFSSYQFQTIHGWQIDNANAVVCRYDKTKMQWILISWNNNINNA